jgi:hypothetical protein
VNHFARFFFARTFARRFISAERCSLVIESQSAREACAAVAFFSPSVLPFHRLLRALRRCVLRSTIAVNFIFASTIYTSVLIQPSTDGCCDCSRETAEFLLQFTT